MIDQITKVAGLEAIAEHTAERIAVMIKESAMDANKNLIDALFNESLLQAVDKTIVSYTTEIEKCQAILLDIDARLALQTDPRTIYNIRKEKKPVEATLRAHENGRNRMLERKANALEKINGHRFDAQSAQYRIDFYKNLPVESVVESLKTYIATQNAPQAEAEAQAIIDAEQAAADADTDTGEETTTGGITVVEDEVEHNANTELADTQDDIDSKE